MVFELAGNTLAKKRVQKPRRYRNIPSNASIEAARRSVAETLGLPIDSIKLVLPSGRKANYNATVETLRRWWGTP
jgi:hypothetical protein